MDTSASFGELVRHHRLKKALTQAGLASRAGLSTSYVTLMEMGKRCNPSWPAVANLVRALELTRAEADALYQAAGYPPPIGKTQPRRPQQHPVLGTLERYLSLPTHSADSLKLLRRALWELLTSAGRRPEREKEKQELRQFSLLKMAFFHRTPEAGQRGGKGLRGQGLSRTDRLNLKLASYVHDLLGLFVDGRTPLDRRVALAREILSHARGKQRVARGKKGRADASEERNSGPRP